MTESTAIRALERTKVKPILFSGSMVRALIEGRKTQTRRVLRVRPTKKTASLDDWQLDGVRIGPLPYAPGDLLWVRESFITGWPLVDDVPDQYDENGSENPLTVWYRATRDINTWLDESGNHACSVPWASSIHMPRWASRLTLEVTAVKVERLQEISETDAISEGIGRSPHGNGDHWMNYPVGSSAAGWADPRESFRSLWDSLNAKRGYGWEDNPWVCAIAFRVHQMNVDAFLAQREAA